MYAAHKNETKKECFMSVIREQCLGRGCGGIKKLSTVFRRLDVDYSKKLCFRELEHGMKAYGVHMDEGDLKEVFQTFDLDRSGYIDFSEFMQSLRPNMSTCRVQVINEAFDKLDINKDGELQVDDLRVVYAGNIKRHPKYISGEWTEEEALRNFLDSLDTPGCPDGKVTRQEFLNYYAGVSATIDDDCYFDLMMRSCYGLRPRGST